MPNISYTNLIITAIIGWGIGAFFHKIANTNIHPIIVSTLLTALYLTITPFAWIFIKFDYQINAIGIITALIGGVFMCVGSIAYFFALQKGDAGHTTILTALYPSLTLILSVAFLGEPLNIKKVIGCALALCSFYFLALK